MNKYVNMGRLGTACFFVTEGTVTHKAPQLRSGVFVTLFDG